MGKAPADQFYWGDWMNDTALQSASTVSRGVWINMLCRMWFAPIRGELKGTREALARLCNANETEMITLENDVKTHDFAEMITDDVTGMITLRNRRMYRKALDNKNTYIRLKRHRQKKRDNANDNGTCNANETAPSSSSINTPISPETCNGNANGHPPYADIRRLWAEICPSLPQPKKENDGWYTECKARYHQYALFREQGSEWVERFLRKFMDDPWWESGKWRRPGIEWVWKKRNFFKIVER